MKFNRKLEFKATSDADLSIEVLNFAQMLPADKQKLAKILLRDCQIYNQQHRVLIETPTYEQAFFIKKDIGFDIYNHYKKKMHFEFKNWINKPSDKQIQESMLKNLNPYSDNS